MKQKPHRIERLTNRLAERIEQSIDMMARELGGPPPFSVKLTEAEQLEQYFAMTPEKWQSVIQDHGLSRALDYSEAMQKLVARHYGPSEPQVIMAGDLSGQPTPQGGMPALPNPDPQQVNSQAQMYVRQALMGVGINPGLISPAASGGV